MTVNCVGKKMDRGEYSGASENTNMDSDKKGLADFIV